MTKVLVIVPLPLGEEAVERRRRQLQHVKLGPDMEFDFRPVKAGPIHFMGRHDEIFMEFAIFEAGLTAAEEGYDAVCVDTTSDSGDAELRSMLDIPVLATGRSAMLYSLMLANNFSLLGMYDPDFAESLDATRNFFKSVLDKSGLAKHCASVALYQTHGDYDLLYEGREDEVFPKMLEACQRAVAEDGAQCICLGSTAMYQAGDYLAERLPVPVVNPGPLSYRLVETVLLMGHRQSRVAYPEPLVRRDAAIHAMLDAAQKNQK